MAAISPAASKAGGPPRSALQRTQALEARVAAVADDDVIVQRDADRFGRIAHLARHVETSAREAVGSPEGCLCSNVP
jgi:hypothetical protein